MKTKANLETDLIPDSPEWFDAIARHMIAADAEKKMRIEVFHSGGGIWLLSVTRLADGRYFTFGTADSHWGADVWRNEDAADRGDDDPDILNLPTLKSDSSDFQRVAETLVNAVLTYQPGT